MYSIDEILLKDFKVAYISPKNKKNGYSSTNLHNLYDKLIEVRTRTMRSVRANNFSYYNHTTG